MPINEIEDKQAYQRLLIEDKETALGMLRDRRGHYHQQVIIGGKQFKIFTAPPDELFTKRESDFLPAGCAAFIVSVISRQKADIARSDFRNWYFAGDADFKGAEFAAVANFAGAVFVGVADFRGAKFAKYADFEGATFNKFRDSTGCS